MIQWFCRLGLVLAMFSYLGKAWDNPDNATHFLIGAIVSVWLSSSLTYYFGGHND